MVARRPFLRRSPTLSSTIPGSEKPPLESSLPGDFTDWIDKTQQNGVVQVLAVPPRSAGEGGKEKVLEVVTVASPLW